MGLLIALWVACMGTEVLTKNEDWTRFNSSLLIEVTRPNGVFTCSGVAVSDQIVVTAAHCLDGIVTKVRIFTQSTYNPKLPSLEIKNFILHPKYNPTQSRYKNDVAKITLKEKLPGSIQLYPIYEGNYIAGNLYRFGFGERNKKNYRTVITPTFKNLNSSESILELNDLFSKSGDSGGPIYLEMGKNVYLLAVHSTLSHGPQGNYSFNPLLSNYLSWIYSN